MSQFGGFSVDEHSANVTSNGLLSLEGLRSNLAETMEQCMQALERSGLSPYGNQGKLDARFFMLIYSHIFADDGSSWCNATWDTVLCWPSTRSNTSITLQCPPLKGLDPTSL